MYNLNFLYFPLLPRKKIVAMTYDSTLVYKEREHYFSVFKIASTSVFLSNELDTISFLFNCMTEIFLEISRNCQANVK
jgi:hypothetical protein